MDGSRSLRPATDDDLEKVLDIEARIHAAPWNRASFVAEMAKPYSCFLVLTDDETDSEVAGYIVFWLMEGECQILNLGVDLPFRRRGFAKVMVRQAVHQALKKGIRRLVLDVRKSNLSAIQLYQSVNFSITHVRKGFYSNGEDGYQMVLMLEDDGLNF